MTSPPVSNKYWKIFRIRVFPFSLFTEVAAAAAESSFLRARFSTFLSVRSLYFFPALLIKTGPGKEEDISLLTRKTISTHLDKQNDWKRNCQCNNNNNNN